jgi:exodeoxyribonuclease VIII
MDITTGRYDNISIEQYHRECPGWSKSALDKVNRSMAHYFASKETKEQTPAMLFGSAFHCAVLEPSRYDLEYCVEPEVDKRTKEGKAKYAEFIQLTLGLTPISGGSAESIAKMRDAIYSHPTAGALFNAGDAEHSFFWTDPKTGLLCKCRPDYLRKDNIVVELKTTSDASYFSFQKDIAKYRYYVQGAFFCDGISSVIKESVNEFIVVAIEKEEPYGIGIYKLDEDCLNIGRAAYRMDLQKIVAYENTPDNDKWAGYPEFVQDMFLPGWVN